MSTPEAPKDFIRTIVAEDLASGKHETVVTRFPPEPNGYLHIGHARAICLNFGIAEEFGGRCHLRLDDTNPAKEEARYVAAIQEDIRWLGYDWGEHLYYASDYFETLYQWAEHLIEHGKAYVDEQDPETIRAQRGTLTEPGVESPYRDRPKEESLDLFRRMRAGEFPDGAMVLRARIDMASPNLNLRDPVIYRILHKPHPHAGDQWCIYPMYDFAHGQSDAIEGITHSLCSLEFENHRPLYDWFLDNLPVPHRPRQIEFARFNLSYTVMSKRKLLRLVEEGRVSGWDDPRMPTLSGLRRRGYTPSSIRSFMAKTGITKTGGTVEVALLEATLRDELNETAPRRMAVLRPLKLTITNWPAGRTVPVEVPNHPGRPELGTREVPFGGSLWIERDDFREEPPKKFFRLAPGREVRLRYAFNVVCDEVVKDASGRVVELKCRYDPESRGGGGRKVKGIIHWVSAEHGVPAEVRLYDHLFRLPDPEAEGDFLEALNPASLETVRAVLEPALAAAGAGERFQFERAGYFWPDPIDHRPEAPVFNRIVALRDSWAKIEKKGG
ncbi:MAG: glutamine--tRNA ligase/YqeY domain fusion protein [Planctomycetota bacterium]|nr:MAG: glutamine--tRNA ligase/YqeY domain fusion protein [Planctomycetota bacterium]